MTEDLYKAFELLLFGWSGVFVVILIIYLASLLLTKTFPIKK
ncbi:OadG-related small transporter subunit [Enterococcus faecium]|nr:OadG-related small transporter subunit [Enterococcus faecium]MCO5434468.1 OadG-related small transporter subunit [Enterococcus faecium]